MIVIILAGMALIGAGWIFAFRRYWESGLHVSAVFQPDAVYAGEQARLTEVVENRKKLPVPVIEVRFVIKSGLIFTDVENANISDSIYKRDIFSVLGMQKITRNIIFACEKRGYYKVKDAELMAFSLLHTEQYIKKLPIRSALYVYPKRVDVTDVLSVSMRMLGEVQREKYISEDPFAFRSIREYTPLDPQKTINWKASAKTGQLMVNTFDSSLRGRFMIYLDVEDSGIVTYENLIEDAISVAATLAAQFVRSGMEVGLAFNTGKKESRFLEPAGGQMQSVRIDRRLAEYDKDDGSCPFSDILKRRPQDAVLIFISKEQRRYRDIETFLGGDKNAVWIYPTDLKETPVCKAADRNIRFLVREVS